MRRWVLAMLLVSCAGPTTPDARPALPIAQPVVDAAIGDAAITPAPPLRTSVPSASLTQLAIPADGSYIITVDAVGSVRLWSTLDGTREPVIVKTQRAERIATLPDGQTIAIATIDRLGQLEIVRTTRDGGVIDRMRIDRERPIAHLVATSRGFIGVQDDELIAFDAHGTVTSMLRSGPGDRITDMIARDEHVLVLFDGGTHRRGRALSLGATLAWGARTARFVALDDAPMVLSPDARRVLVRTIADESRGANIAIVELATGAATDPPENHYFEGEPKIFLDARTVVFSNGTEVYRWKLGAVPTKLSFQLGPTALIGSTLVSGYDATLSFSRASTQGAYKTTYLGYRLTNLVDLVPATDGWVATDRGSVLHLDRELHADRTLHAGAVRDAVTLIDATHAAIQVEGAITVYDFATGTHEKLDAAGYITDYQRSTGLALLYQSAAPKLLRWAHGHFASELLSLADGDIFAAAIYDPATAHGVVAAYSKVDSNDAIELTTIGEVDPRGPLPFKRVHTHRFPLSEENEQENVVAHLPVARVMAASRDGSLIAEVANGRMSLRDPAGNVRWERVSVGTNLAWNADDELVAFGGGAAFVDLETGALHGAVCGWDFGVWDRAPQIASSPSAQYCEADE